MIDLNLYTEKARPHLSKPWRHDGFVYATNGIVAVRIFDEAGIDAADAATVSGKVIAGAKKLFTERCPSSKDAYAPFSLAIPKRNECQSCDGTGTLAECDNCDGEGRFTRGRHDYDCKECAGLGGFKLDGDDTDGWPTTTCWSCYGSGEAPDQFIKIDTLHFNRRYLAMISGLDGLCYRIAPPLVRLDDPLAIQDVGAFRFNGGHAILMPCRV